MMAGNPNWWTMHPPSLIPPQHERVHVLASSSSSSSIPLAESPEPPQSWSQLLLYTGFPGEEERLGLGHFQPKKLQNWDHQILNPTSRVPDIVDAIVSQSGNSYGHMVPVSSPTFTPANTMLDFSHNKNQTSDECNSIATVGVCKKPRVLPCSSQPPLKVRKEKLGDRITALHQLVSPFGKTDTASVLLEAFGYIRFLQGQIEALSSPYLDDASKNMRNQQSVTVHGERNYVFPEDPGQLLNDNGLKRMGATITNQVNAEDTAKKDLRSRGLCLVPVSCTQHVGNKNGADYWAPACDNGF